MLWDAYVQGEVAPGFGAVREAFVRNFAERDELGAAVAVFRGGELVVDLWGGFRDASRTRPWTGDTAVMVFSTTKGMAAAALAVAHSRGLFALDDPVSRHWPEFAQRGKGEVTVRQLLAHQAGLSALEVHLTPALMADPVFMAEALARQRPLWPPGRNHGYHAFTLGWYGSELLRRVDPAGRRLPAFFADEVAGPLGITFTFGHTAGNGRTDVASIVGWPAWKMLLNVGVLPIGMAFASMNPWSITNRTLTNPPLASPAQLDSEPYHALEMPAAIGYGSARDVATVYGDLAVGGQRLGLRRQTFEAITEPATPPSAGWHDLVVHCDTAYGFGWGRPTSRSTLGSPHAFGAPGAGGSFGFADPEQQVGYAYVTNRMGFHAFDDPRDLALRRALAGCLAPRAATAHPT